ncbi:hypothetical protein OG339_47230 (plasmid) [Streptosporangium sp. NBC_01495]|uniref:hypothetical protein n=1 Tax=Streptosporangium sp. NBC_01495 TaxID=2903899 RepID=UPI002E32E2FF|nr:hypothetical protein [Streptosporangium sp. NBC_01495]
MTDDDGLGPARERTEDLLAALDRGDIDGPAGVRAMLTYLGRRGEIGVMLVTWAQLLAVCGRTGAEPFADVAAPWVAHARALVVAARGADGEGQEWLRPLAAPLQSVMTELEDDQIWELAWHTLIEVYAVLQHVGGGAAGLRRLRAVAHAHRPFAPGAHGAVLAVVVAALMSGQTAAAHHALTGVLADPVDGPRATAEAVGAWVALAAETMISPGSTLLLLDEGVPQAVLDTRMLAGAELGAESDEIGRGAALMAIASRAITALRAGDADPLRELTEVSEADRMVLAWHLAGTVATLLSRAKQ